MQPGKHRFLLYWLGLWAVLAPLVSVWANPPSSHDLQVFWNPHVWGAMFSVAFLLAWSLCRYRAQINAFGNDDIVKRFAAATGMLMWALNIFEPGTRESSPYLKTALAVLLFFALIMTISGIGMAIKRVHSRLKTRPVPQPTSKPPNPPGNHMNLPIFAIVGVQAVKAARTEDGGMGVYVFDKETQDFKLTWDYFDALFEHSDDTDFVSEQEFDRYVESLRNPPE